jgi:hypothetical protein
MASSGRLARVLQRLHSTSSQPRPPLRLAYGRRRLRGAAVAFHPQRHARASARSAAFPASSRACRARIFAPMIWPPQMTSRDLVPMVALQGPCECILGIDAGNAVAALQVRSSRHAAKETAQARLATWALLLGAMPGAAQHGSDCELKFCFRVAYLGVSSARGSFSQAAITTRRPEKIAADTSEE